MNLHLVLLIVYSIALVAVGLWMSRAVRGSADFFVAGRRLSAPLLFSTVLAANIGAGTTIGAAGVGYRDGISAWWWNGSAAIGSLALAFWVGPRIWKVASEHNLYTVGDYLELRYGRALRGLMAVLLWFGTLSILAGQLIGGSAILTVVAGIPREAGILLSAVVMTVYFVAGGLLSAAWVNLVQLIVLVSGFVVALPLVLANVGMTAASTGAALPDGFGSMLYSSGARSGWTFLFLLAPSFVISPGLLQKTYGASSAGVVTRGIGWQALAQAIFGFFPVILGMTARVVHPGITDANLVLPTVLIEQLPAALSALALAAVFSAEVSTCDAILFMLATSLSQDLYRRFMRPSATDEQIVRVARVAAVGGAVGGVLLALRLPTVTAALGIFYALLSVTLFVPVLGGLYTVRARTPHAMAAVVAGGVTALLVMFVPHAPIWWLDPAVAGLVMAAAAFSVAMVVWREPSDRAVR